MPKPEVHPIRIVIRSPKGDFPGQESEGRYIVEDGVVTLTDHDGSVVHDPSGKTYTHRLGLGPNDAHAHTMAGVLAEPLCDARKGNRPPRGFGGGSGDGFNRTLTYNNKGII